MIYLFLSCMKKSSVFSMLVWYYGLLQLAHFAMNLIIIFMHPELLTQASPLLTSSQAHYFVITSLADFILASPLGIVWAILFFSAYRKIALRLVSLSLIIAWLTAVLYVALLLMFHAFTLNSTTIIFGVLFIPVIILTIMYLPKNKK